MRPSDPSTHEGPDGHTRNGAPRRPGRRQYRHSEPLAPRTLALAAAGVVVLVLLVFGLTRMFAGSSGASPAAAPPTPAAAAAVAPASVSPTPLQSQGPVQTSISPVEPTYTVQSGDTLATIARRFNTSVEALQSINNLPDRNTLRVGQRLIIP